VLTQTLSVVVPVYRAGAGLQEMVRELMSAAAAFALAPQVDLHLDEIILVVDNPSLPVAERAAVSALEEIDSRVRTVWLARNFGQHPATVAGIVSTNGDWVVTMDEDGQHDPREIPEMLLVAARSDVPLVYARPTNAPPHGAARNAASRATKRLFRVLSNSKGDFHSFRLIEGSIARSACAYIGDNVYLDVAMQWSCGDAAFSPMLMRAESTASSYSPRKLLSHFWRMVLSTGTRPLRLIAVGGVIVTLLGLLVAVVVAQRRLSGEFPAPGWTSVMITQLILAGGVFIALATLAEYVGFAVRNTIGKPLYVKTEHAQARVLWTLQAALQGTSAPVS
jgi:undecaprenyl-phosphate 4-deoxy-4-formamido-L-arabinose transferase